MKIGMMTDSLGAASFDDLLGTAAELGIDQFEFAAGNWSPAPPSGARRDARQRVSAR